MSDRATSLLVDPKNGLYLSMASVWEIAIKVGLKKLTLSAPFVNFMTRATTGYGLTVLDVTFDDYVAYEELPFPNKEHRTARLQEISSEYRSRLQAEQQSESSWIDVDAKVAHVIYSTG